jgi:hypothetical protein
MGLNVVDISSPILQPPLVDRGGRSFIMGPKQMHQLLNPGRAIAEIMTALGLS